MRICFFGGPGTGKSTVAAYVFYELKKKGFEVELVREYVKTWAWQGKRPQGFDQLYLLAEQMRAEEELLRAGVPLLITDSPLLLSCAYAQIHDFPGWRELLLLTQEFNGAHDSLNILLERGTITYQPSGRFEDLGEIEQVDELLVKFLHKYLGRFPTYCVNEDRVLGTMMRFIDEEVNRGLANKPPANEG